MMRQLLNQQTSNNPPPYLQVSPESWAAARAVGSGRGLALGVFPCNNGGRKLETDWSMGMIVSVDVGAH